jgi:hypothetical protein
MEEKKKTPLMLLVLGAIAVFGVPIAFTFFGWQNVYVDCVRQEFGPASSCEVQNSYFLGLFKTQKRHINNITDVGYQESYGSKNNLISTVVLKNDSGKISVFESSTNTNADEKKKVIREVRKFLENKGQPSLHLSMSFSNIFGWIGLSILIIFAGSSLYWAFQSVFPKKPNSTDKAVQ